MITDPDTGSGIDADREPQLASSVLMIRPLRFESNPLTAASNRFQGRNPDPPGIQQQAAEAEFGQLAKTLAAAGVNVVVFDDTPEPHTPDAVFPNNWVSFHADGTVVLYPMEAPNRRTERRMDIIDALATDHGFEISRIVDLSHHENEGHFLEGTGSMVLDRANRVAYASRSSRTHAEPLQEFAAIMEYELLVFNAVDRGGTAIYHTNVLMNVGEGLAVICSEAISDESQRDAVVRKLEVTGHKVLHLSLDQMQRFAGNMLELRSAGGDRLIAMSRQARDALTTPQLACLADHAQIVSAAIDNIESSAGGSVRCMLAEIHLPLNRPGEHGIL